MDRPPIEELASAPTPTGELSLRRRWDALLGEDIYEVRLGDEYLMSSHFTASEVALATLGLAAVEGDDLEVVVGGLGLGFTARAALEDERISSLIIVDALAEVIRWHEEGLVPGGAELSADPRVAYLHGDFFALVAEGSFDPTDPERRFDAILLDIDHSPDHHLAPSHASFYTPEGLRRCAQLLRDEGVFALWSNDPPDEGFTDRLGDVFASARAEAVSFPTPYESGEHTCTIYVCVA